MPCLFILLMESFDEHKFSSLMSNLLITSCRLRAFCILYETFHFCEFVKIFLNISFSVSLHLGWSCYKFTIKQVELRKEGERGNVDFRLVTHIYHRRFKRVCTQGQSTNCNRLVLAQDLWLDHER